MLPKNMCLKVFNNSLCIYVVLYKLPSMDWSPFYRLDLRSGDSMLFLVVFYLILLCLFNQLPKCCIFGILKHVNCNARAITVRFLANQLNYSLIGSC